MTKVWVGVSRMNITPNDPLIMDGFYSRKGPAVGTHDHIYLTALVMQSCGQRVVIIAADLLGFPPNLVKRLRIKLWQEMRISPENVLFVASHTHSGPAVGNLVFLSPDKDYNLWIGERVKSAIKDAMANMSLCDLFIGCTETECAVNRRLDGHLGEVFMEDNHDGLVNRQLWGMRLVTENGRTLAGAINIGCHPTAVLYDERMYSRDYPGYAIDKIEEKYPCSTFLFLSGSHGDLRPIGNIERSGQKLARECGEQIANDFDTIKWQKVEPPFTLKSCIRTLEVSFTPLPNEDRLKRLYEQYKEQALYSTPDEELWHNANVLWAEKALRCIQDDQNRFTMKVELHGIAITNTFVLIGLPFEVFSETAISIKDHCQAGVQCLVCGYSGGLVGYLPPSHEFERGGYEAEEAFKVYGHISSFAQDTESLVRKSCMELIDDLVNEQQIE